MGLWTRRFALFWAGDTVSAAGGALSAVALPVLALRFGGAAVGAVRAAQTLPFLLLAVPIGLLADRISRRRLLLVADAMRLPLVGAIALLGSALGAAALAVLVFLAGVGTVAYEVAYLSVLPELVDGPRRLPAANRAVESAHAGASLAGPGLGGVLLGVLSPAAVIGIDAVTFGVGAALTAVNRWKPPVASAPPPAGIAAGWTWLRGDPLVRPMTLYLAVNNIAAQAFQTALLLFIVQTLGHSAAAYGAAVAASGAGFLCGALISPAAARRLGTGRVIIQASLVGAFGIGLVAAGTALPAVLLGSAVAGLGPGMLNLHSIAVRQAVTPPPLLGRVTAVVKTVSYGTTTLGALAGGLFAAPRTVLAAAAVVSALATLFPACSAVRSLPPTVGIR